MTVPELIVHRSDEAKKATVMKRLQIMCIQKLIMCMYTCVSMCCRPQNRGDGVAPQPAGYAYVLQAEKQGWCVTHLAGYAAVSNWQILAHLYTF